MAMQTLSGGGFPLPDWPLLATPGLTSSASFLIDATGEKIAFIFVVPRTGTIDRVAFLVGSVTTAQTLRAGLQTVDATTGAPTGTAYGGMVAGTQTSPVAFTLYEVTLGTGATAVVGDTVALVIEFDATIGNLNIIVFNVQNGASIVGLPYNNHFTASWAKSTNSIPHTTVRYSDATYEHVGCQVSGLSSTITFNSTSTPDERGHYFTLPGPMRASGVWFHADVDGILDIVLYDSNGTTVLRTVSFDPDIRAQGAIGIFRIRWDPVSLLRETAYRLVFKPMSATNVIIYEISVLSAAMMGGNPGGTRWYKTSRVDAGAWTEVTTTRVLGLGLLIDQIDDGVSAGGGGLLTHPGMGGGFRG